MICSESSAQSAISLDMTLHGKPVQFTLNGGHYEIQDAFHQRKIAEGFLPLQYRLIAEQIPHDYTIVSPDYTLHGMQGSCIQYCNYIHRFMQLDPQIKESIKKVKYTASLMTRKHMQEIAAAFHSLDVSLFTNPQKLKYIHLSMIEEVSFLEILFGINRMRLVNSLRHTNSFMHENTDISETPYQFIEEYSNAIEKLISFIQTHSTEQLSRHELHAAAHFTAQKACIPFLSELFKETAHIVHSDDFDISSCDAAITSYLGITGIDHKNIEVFSTFIYYILDHKRLKYSEKDLPELGFRLYQIFLEREHLETDCSFSPF